MKPELKQNEFIVATDHKKVTGLVFSLLFNRMVPGFILIPLLVYTAIRPTHMMEAIEAQSRWLMWLYIGMLVAGVIGQILLVYEFFNVKIFITNMRMIVIKGERSESYDPTDIKAFQITSGLLSSDLKITTESSGIHSFELLDCKCIDDLESALANLKK